MANEIDTSIPVTADGTIIEPDDERIDVALVASYQQLGGGDLPELLSEIDRWTVDVSASQKLPREVDDLLRRAAKVIRMWQRQNGGRDEGQMPDNEAREMRDETVEELRKRAMVALDDHVKWRRAQLEYLSTGERAIRNAVTAVEKMGADERLTDAVILLQAARDSVADYIDDVERRQPVTKYPMPQEPTTLRERAQYSRIAELEQRLERRRTLEAEQAERLKYFSNRAAEVHALPEDTEAQEALKYNRALNLIETLAGEYVQAARDAWMCPNDACQHLVRATAGWDEDARPQCGQCGTQMVRCAPIEMSDWVKIVKRIATADAELTRRWVETVVHGTNPADRPRPHMGRAVYCEVPDGWSVGTRVRIAAMD